MFCSKCFVQNAYYFFGRYLELNGRYSEGYRRYNSEVPKYLHNKTPTVVATLHGAYNFCRGNP